ncbi:MAG: phosphatidate cytidylyltransferase [Nitrospinales bacterium]
MKRVLSSVLLLPILIAVIYFGSPVVFYLVVLAAVLLGIYEYFALISEIGITGFPVMGFVLSFLLTLCFYFGGQFLAQWILAATVLLFLAWFVLEKDIRTAFDQIAYTFLGIFYVAGLLGSFVLIRNLAEGQYYVFFVLLVVWLGDTAAYYVGRNFGRHPLAPVISPKKTVEGAVAGLTGSLAGGWIAQLWFLPDVALAHCLIMALICGMIGQFGDLAESLLKRSARAKDSGSLIPGHGGILDRIDGLLFAGPAFYGYYTGVLSP